MLSDASVWNTVNVWDLRVEIRKRLKYKQIIPLKHTARKPVFMDKLIQASQK